VKLKKKEEKKEENDLLRVKIIIIILEIVEEEDIEGGDIKRWIIEGEEVLMVIDTEE